MQFTGPSYVYLDMSSNSEFIKGLGGKGVASSC